MALALDCPAYRKEPKRREKSALALMFAFFDENSEDPPKSKLMLGTQELLLTLQMAEIREILLNRNWEQRRCARNKEREEEWGL